MFYWAHFGTVYFSQGWQFDGDPAPLPRDNIVQIRNLEYNNGELWAKQTSILPQGNSNLKALPNTEVQI